MRSIYSTLTCAVISKRPNDFWTRLESAINSRSIGGRDIQDVSAKNLRVVDTNTSLILVGLIYKNRDMHITITPNSSGEWAYLHATWVCFNKAGGHAYFVLKYDEQAEQVCVTPTEWTVVDYERKKISNSKDFWGNPPSPFINDIGVIMWALINKEYKEGDVPL